MVDSGYTTPTNRIIVKGTPPLTTSHNIKTVANMYPGRLVIKDTNDWEIKVSDGIIAPTGWLGYEEGNPASMPETIDTIYVVDKPAPVHRGGGFTVYGNLAEGTTAIKDDLLASWSAGQVVPCALFDGKIGIKVPFSKSTSEVDTGLELPDGLIVHGVVVLPSTVDASGTIDIGLLSTEASGDADGFADGVSCATAEPTLPAVTVTAGSSETYFASTTVGALLRTFLAGSDAATDVGTYWENVHVCDGTTKTVSYTTSNHTIAGYFYVIVSGPGVQVVGKAGAGADASSAAVDIFVESVL